MYIPLCLTLRLVYVYLSMCFSLYLSVCVHLFTYSPYVDSLPSQTFSLCKVFSTNKKILSLSTSSVCTSLTLLMLLFLHICPSRSVFFMCPCVGYGVGWVEVLYLSVSCAISLKPNRNSTFAPMMLFPLSTNASITCLSHPLCPSFFNTSKPSLPQYCIAFLKNWACWCDYSGRRDEEGGGGGKQIRLVVGWSSCAKAFGMMRSCG